MSLSTTQIEKLKFHFGEILKNCEGEFEKGCGSYMFDGKTYLFDEKLLPKQNLLYEKTLNKNKALEIGTYMGHSLLLMLIANPKIEVTTIDIEKNTNPRLQVKSAEEYAEIMNNLNLPSPKLMDVAVPRNLKLGKS